MNHLKWAALLATLTTPGLAASGPALLFKTPGALRRLRCRGGFGRWLAIALLVAAGLPVMAAPPPTPDEALEAAGARAMEEGDYAKVIELSRPPAEAGDAEFQFTLGYVAYLWLEDPAPRQPPRYTLEEAVAWIRRAAHQDLPQAAAFLRAGHERGDFGLPQDPSLAECWRAVELAQRRATACEALASQRTPDE